MNFDPDFLAAARSDDELMERVENRQKYMPETIEASLTELQRRGRTFSEEEIRYINEDIAARRSHSAAMTGRMGIFTSEYKNVIVDDPDAPKMYSTMAIYLFTFFMGPLFGSIMMAMNISKTGKSNAVAGVILFGIGFAILGIYLMANVQSTSGSIQIICGLVGAYCLNYLFWRPYIGFDTFYRARPIWGALIIAVLLAGLLIFSIASNPVVNKVH
jgi:hypothetical protein